MNYLITSVISLFILNGINSMELSKVSQILAANTTPATKNVEIVNHEKPVLIAPDKLFTNNKMAKGMSTNLNFLQTKGLINSDTKVLHIGDSHTAGVYGKEIDNLMRSTGAKVTTVGSSGSSPSWFLNGTSTKSGFYSKDDEGNVDSPKDWKSPHVTPKLTDLINKSHPDIIVFSLGANLVHASGERIDQEVKKVLDIAKANNAKIIWVGPPNGRKNVKPDDVQNFLYEHLKKVVDQYGGEFIDSRPYTFYPDNLKGDGVHFGGTEGSKIAKDWANNIFNQIQKTQD